MEQVSFGSNGPRLVDGHPVYETCSGNEYEATAGRTRGPKEKDLIIIQSAFPPAPTAVPFHLGGAGSAYAMVTKEMVEYLLGRCSDQSVPGEDRVGAEVVKTLLGWDANRVTPLVAECIRLGNGQGNCDPKAGLRQSSGIQSRLTTRLTREIGRAT